MYAAISKGDKIRRFILFLGGRRLLLLLLLLLLQDSYMLGIKTSFDHDRLIYTAKVSIIRILSNQFLQFFSISPSPLLN